VAADAGSLQQTSLSRIPDDEYTQDDDWTSQQPQAVAKERCTKLRMFLDSASSKELTKWARMGIFYGMYGQMQGT